MEQSSIHSYSYFVLQVKTGNEGKYISSARRALDDRQGKLIWPRRTMVIRKGGEKREIRQSLYPGYLFFETQELSDDSIMALKRTPGFIHFLKSNHDIIPLDRRDRETFCNLVSYGEVLGKSLAVFDENNRIRVVDGPLSRLEGNIVRVDRRKGRARVALTLHGRTLLADLSFDTLEAVPEWKPGKVSIATSVG